MTSKVYDFLTRPYSVVVVLAIATVLSLSDRNFGYFFGLGIVIYIAWRKKWDWSVFGFGRKITRRTFAQSLVLAVAMFVFVDVLIQPFLEIHFGKIDLSSLSDIRGDMLNYSIIIGIMWIFSAFGEELLFRGYYMKQLARMFGGTDTAWLISAAVISIYFGVSHSYQGTAGMIAVGLVGLINALIFCRNRDNLALLALAHGFYDTIGLTLIYLDKDRLIFDWVERWLNS